MSKVRKTRKFLIGRGSVLLISAFLLGSAAIRVAVGAGSAIAEGDLGSQIVLPGAMVAKAPAQQPQGREAIKSLLEALKAREARVEEQEMQMAMRAKALNVAQAEIERRLDALETAEESLSATLAHAETAAEDDLARLTTVYENMKPKDAAGLFGAMEPEFAAGFLARMRPDVAAKVMSGLDPQAAYSISAILAGRNARAPKS